MTTLLLRETVHATHQLLKKIANHMEEFLNAHTLTSVTSNEQDTEDLYLYYRGYFQDMRHLLVHCESISEKLAICLRRVEFNNQFAEELLQQTYQLCVMSFFYPQNQAYEEQSTTSCTDRDKLVFHTDEVNSAIKKFTLTLVQPFEDLRDILYQFEANNFMQDNQTAKKTS